METKVSYLYLCSGMRKIIHIDMDAFYASIEERDHPELRHIPLAVGHADKRGVVATANYEARRYGVHSAMSSKRALQLCPQLVFTEPRFNVYKNVSRQISDIFHDYTDKVEPLSLDEAYLDVTNNHRHMPSATLLAREIKQRIRETTGLTASAGVSFNKFLAKVASDYHKPDGLFVITADKAEAFVETLKIEQFWGVGKQTAIKMHNMGIFTGADLKKRSREELIACFGKAGLSYYQHARAIDHREVISFHIRKSVGAEHTFPADTADETELADRLKDIAAEVNERIRKQQFLGRTLTLKIKFTDFQQITRSRTVSHFLTETEEIYTLCRNMLAEANSQHTPIRLLGISISRSVAPLYSADGQLQLNFADWNE